MECYICALGPEDTAKPATSTIEGPRLTVGACDEHYSAVVWPSVAKGYPKIWAVPVRSS